MQRLVEAPWPGNVRQLRNLIESMVVLAPGSEIRAADIPPDVLEGAGRLLPVRIGPGGAGGCGARNWSSSSGISWTYGSRSRSCGGGWTIGPQRVQVIELGESQPVADVLPVESTAEERGAVVYRPGMTMAEVEKEAIEAALTEYRGNRRKAAEVLGIGERTLYRKIKAYKLGLGELA